MRIVFLNLLLASVVMAGFFNEEAESEKAQQLENARLCKLFTKKIEEYKKSMRSDILAKTTLASYEHRASLFCANKKDPETKAAE